MESSEQKSDIQLKPAQASKSGTTNKRITGTVKWFNVKEGFGFIKRHDTGEDVFVHKTSIIRPNSKHYVKSIGDGEIVEFALCAAKVTGPGFKQVKGSPFVAQKGARTRPNSSTSGRVKREDRKGDETVGDGVERDPPGVVGQMKKGSKKSASLTSVPQCPVFSIPDQPHSKSAVLQSTGPDNASIPSQIPEYVKLATNNESTE